MDTWLAFGVIGWVMSSISITTHLALPLFTALKTQETSDANRLGIKRNYELSRVHVTTPAAMRDLPTQSHDGCR